MIQVIPDEIRYWIATEGAIARAVGVALGAVIGKSHTPGELRTITKAEVSL